MKERELIEILCQGMPRANTQINSLFESDAEILQFGDQFLLFSTDEFSDEDLLATKDPYALGHNIACAAISDILAAGGKPLYYAHSLTVDHQFQERYMERFARGAGDVLREAGCGFIGGDFGRSEHWRCCASVIGITDTPVKRSGARHGDHIYITGAVGAGNMQAALSLYKIPFSGLIPNFSLRINALPDIQKYATSCIDTSDGLFQSVKTIARMSGTGFALENIPYLGVGKLLAKATRLPLEMLALCECGEYELLFTSPRELPYLKIGTITEGGMTMNNKDVSHIDLSARSHQNLSAYLKEVQRLCEEL